MLLLRNLIGLFIIISWLGCSKNDTTGGHPMPWLYGITEAQKQLHRDFKAIINDTGPFGKLDSFLVDTIYCNMSSGDTCREISIDFFNNAFVLNQGDVFVLKEGRIRIMDIPFTGGNFHDIGLIQSSLEDFKYIEFGIMQNGEMKNCCFYSSLVRLDVANKEIEFTYPLISLSNYLIRLKGID